MRWPFLCAVAALLPIGAMAGEEFPTGFTDTPFLPGGPWRVHDENRPRPSIVTPGGANTPESGRTAPSDAVVLFDGRDLKAWRSVKTGDDARWVVREGYMEVAPGTGDIETRALFADSQIHLEFATPDPPANHSQGRGNSGVFLHGLYEIQILDSFDNKTFADGQASAVFGQTPPLVNASRPPGEWQSFDILYTVPRFKDGQLQKPGYVTVLHNGVVSQNHTQLMGAVAFRDLPRLVVHPIEGRIQLQDHSYPVRFRNIWVRRLDAP